MSPQEKAWEEYRRRGLSSDKPVEVMHALLDAYAREAAVRDAVRRYVTAPEDTTERILAFSALVKLVNP